ncbi:Transcription factor bHLH71 [Linum perenne]
MNRRIGKSGFHSYMLGAVKIKLSLPKADCSSAWGEQMATEAMLSAASPSNELMNFIVIYDTISATPCADDGATFDTYFPENLAAAAEATPPPPLTTKQARGGGSVGGGGGGRSRKRRRKAKVCKNKEEAETQRMTHIAVERNRRKLMNEHLALLRSLMPPSYVQRGDQASIVAGAIEFVKQLEHSLHTLQAKKHQHQSPPLAEFFNHASTSSTQDTTNSNKFTSSYNNTKTILTTTSSSSTDEARDAVDGIAGIEVTLIETHANLRFLTRKRTRPWQLSKLIGGFHALRLGVLHFSLATVHPFSLYSISAKVEEGCQLTSVDDIAAAVHHMLRLIIEQEDDDPSSSTLLLP